MSSVREPDIEKIRNEVELRPDGTMIWKVGKRRRRVGAPAFATLTNGYYCGMFDGVRLFAHRVVWALTHGSWPDGWIDHINRDRGDNRPENLRVTDAALSNHNRDFANLYKGIFKNPNASTYRAQIRHNGKQYYLGCFPTPEEAALARDKKAVELYGNNAVLNFPEKFPEVFSSDHK